MDKMMLLRVQVNANRYINMNRFDIAVKSSVRVLCVWLLAGNVYAVTYKWVDADGNVQYTQMPPPAGIEAETIAPPPAVDSDAAIKQMQEEDSQAGELRKQRLEQEKNESRAAEAVALQKKNCQMARDRLASYDRPRVKFEQKDGSKVRATEEERQEQIKISEGMIKEYCKE